MAKKATNTKANTKANTKVGAKAITKEKAVSNVNLAIEHVKANRTLEQLTTTLTAKYKARGKNMSAEWYAKRAAIYFAIAERALAK